MAIPRINSKFYGFEPMSAWFQSALLIKGMMVLALDQRSAWLQFPPLAKHPVLHPVSKIQAVLICNINQAESFGPKWSQTRRTIQWRKA